MRTIDLRTDLPQSLYLDVRYDPRLPKSDQFTLLVSLVVVLTDGRICRLLAGLLSDGASVPALLWFLLRPVDNRVLLAYVVHDYLYEYWELFDPQKSIPDPRKYADQTMYQIMRQIAPNRTLRNYLFYAGVRAFGSWNWTYYRKLAATNP